MVVPPKVKFHFLLISSPAIVVVFLNMKPQRKKLKSVEKFLKWSTKKRTARSAAIVKHRLTMTNLELTWSKAGCLIVSHINLQKTLQHQTLVTWSKEGSILFSQSKRWTPSGEQYFMFNIGHFSFLKTFSCWVLLGMSHPKLDETSLRSQNKSSNNGILKPFQVTWQNFSNGILQPFQVTWQTFPMVFCSYFKLHDKLF